MYRVARRSSSSLVSEARDSFQYDACWLAGWLEGSREVRLEQEQEQEREREREQRKVERGSLDTHHDSCDRPHTESS